MSTLSSAAIASAIVLALAGCDAGRDDTRKADVNKPATTAGTTSPSTASGTTPPATTSSSSPSSNSGAAGKPSTTVGQKVDDTAITSKVKTALMADDEIKGMNINVDTKGGEVKLTGNVQSDAQAKKAMEIARGVDGVTGVQNNLQVKKGG
jgi:hyperosmotically inducible protein